MIKLLKIFSLLLLFSCNGKSDKSMEDLTNAFIQWFDNNHESNIRYLNKGNYFYKNIYNETEFNEYKKDLNKFELELSQINYIKLNKSNLVDYELLDEKINNLILINNIVDVENVSADLILQSQYYSLYNVLNNNKLQMNDRILRLFKVIKKNNKTIVLIKEKNNKIETRDLINYNINYNILINYINNIPLKVNSDINTLNRLDDKIEYFKKNLSSFKTSIIESKHSINHEYDDNKLLFNEITFKVSNQYFNVKNNKIPNNVDYRNHLNSLINSCVHYYLKDNDEPVWTDIDDTLSVIKWVIDNKLNDNIIEKSLVDQYYMIYKDLDDYLNRLNINITNNIPGIYSKEFELDIFKERSLISFEDIIINTDSSIINNKYSIFYEISNNILMNHYISRLKNTKLSYILSDKYYINGFSKYLQEILFYNNFYSEDNLYKIYRDIELLREVVYLICQHNYFNEDYGKKEILFKLKKFALINEKNSLLIFNDISRLNEIYIKQYMYFLKFLSSDKKNNNLDKYIDNLYIPINN